MLCQLSYVRAGPIVPAWKRLSADGPGTLV
jgi:hypothetical protein